MRGPTGNSVCWDRITLKVIPVIFMLQEWTDDRLTWKPEDFGNVTDIILKPDKIWLPELAVMNG